MKELPVAALYRFLVPAAVIVTGLVLSLVLDPLRAWMFLAVSMVAAILIPNPRHLLFLYFVWVLFGTMLIDSKLNIGIGIPGIRYIDEFLTAALTLCLFGQMTMVRRVRASLAPLVLCMLLLLGVIGLSAYVNGSSKFLVFKFASSYLGFIPIMLVLLEYAPKPAPARIMFLLVTVLFVQIALNVAWYFGFNPIGNYDSGGPDFAHGTLGGCNYVAYFCVFVILLSISRLLEHRAVPAFRAPLALLLGMVALVQLLFTFTAHALLLLGACGGLLFVLGVPLKYLKPHRLFALAAVAIVILAIAMTVVSVAGVGEGILTFLKPEVLAMRFEAMRTGPTANIYRNVFFDLWHEVPVPLLGAGPGGFGSSVAIEYGAPLTRKYLWIYYLTISGREMIRGSSITQSLISGISAMWGDLGAIGALLYFSLYIIPARRIWRHLVANRYQDPFQRTLSRVYMPYFAMLVLITLLQDIFWNDLMQCSFLFLSAYLWDPIAVAAPPVVEKPAPARSRLSQPGLRLPPLHHRPR